MLTIRSPADAEQIDDPAVRALVEERLTQLGDCDPDETVLVVVERSDTLKGLEKETGLAIATDPFSEARYPSPNFLPVWDWALEHKRNGCWECAFVTSDSSSTTLFVPQQSGIDSMLMALCTQFAETVIPD